MSQKKSLSSSRSWISSPASISCLRWYGYGRCWPQTSHREGPGSPAGLTRPVVGNTCCHSHGGEDSLLRPLPHLSPFALQPVWSLQKRTNQPKILPTRVKEVDLTQLCSAQHAPYNLTCACASSSTAKREKRHVNFSFNSCISEKTHIYWTERERYT